MLNGDSPLNGRGGAGLASEPVEIVVSVGEVGERANASDTAPIRDASGPGERDVPEERRGDQSSSGHRTVSTGSVPSPGPITALNKIIHNTPPISV